MRAPVWGLLAAGWVCALIQTTQSAVISDRNGLTLRTLLSDKGPNKGDDEEPERYNLIIIPLIAFGAFMVFLCMRCCHWNQKDFRDRGIIIEHHHHKKNIAKGLIHTRFDGQSQRRLSCVPEQLMLLPLFLTGSARSDLNKMVDPPTDGIVEKVVETDSDEHSHCSSEPPSSDSEFDTPFPYQSPGRRRSSSVPPDILIKGRFKKSRSSSIIDMRARTLRRMSVVSAVSAKSTPHSLVSASTMQSNHNPNLLSVTAELHEPPRSFSQNATHSGDVTPESIVYPLPGEQVSFPSEIRITRDVYVETKNREIGVDTSDLYPPPCMPLTDVNHSLYVIQHRKFARVRKVKSIPKITAVPSNRKRRRCDEEETVGCVMALSRIEKVLIPRFQTTGIKNSKKRASNAEAETVNNKVFTIESCDMNPVFAEFNPFEPAVTNGVSPNSSGHSFSNESDHVMLSLPPLSLSPISSNSEFYRRLCSSEDSALAKSPISEFSTDDRSARDPLSRDGTLSPPPVRLNGRLFLHSRPNMQNSQDDDVIDHVILNRVDSGKYSDTSTHSRGRGYHRHSSSEPRSQLASVSSECDDNSVTQPLLNRSS